MVYGAACAGARAMTSSSSPGFSLMQEGLSYIAASGVPCVLVDMMRGGPGLGNIAPTQADYFQLVQRRRARRLSPYRAGSRVGAGGRRPDIRSIRPRREISRHRDHRRRRHDRPDDGAGRDAAYARCRRKQDRGWELGGALGRAAPHDHLDRPRTRRAGANEPAPFRARQAAHTRPPKCAT